MARFGRGTVVVGALAAGVVLLALFAVLVWVSLQKEKPFPLVGNQITLDYPTDKAWTFDGVERINRIAMDAEALNFQPCDGACCRLIAEGRVTVSGPFREIMPAYRSGNATTCSVTLQLDGNSSFKVHTLECDAGPKFQVGDRGAGPFPVYATGVRCSDSDGGIPPMAFEAHAYVEAPPSSWITIEAADGGTVPLLTDSRLEVSEVSVTLREDASPRLSCASKGKNVRFAGGQLRVDTVSVSSAGIDTTIVAAGNFEVCGGSAIWPALEASFLSLKGVLTSLGGLSSLVAGICMKLARGAPTPKLSMRRGQKRV